MSTPFPKPWELLDRMHQQAISRTPLLTPELRRILHFGVVLLGATFAYFLYLTFRHPEPFQRVWQLVVVHFVGGRAGNVSLGLTYGFDRWFLLYQCLVQDIIILLLVYPFFVASLQRAERIRYIGPTLGKLHEAALRHRDRIEPYGAVGLVLFVVFPFWSTGLLVGAVVGHVLGMRRRVAFASVIVGDLVAVALWVLFFDWLNRHSEGLVRGVLAVAIVAGLVGIAVRRVRENRDRKARRAALIVELPPPDPAGDEPDAMVG